jgi:hypothetical protein
MSKLTGPLARHLAAKKAAKQAVTPLENRAAWAIHRAAADAARTNGASLSKAQAAGFTAVDEAAKKTIDGA